MRELTNVELEAVSGGHKRHHHHKHHHKVHHKHKRHDHKKRVVCREKRPDQLEVSLT